MKQREEPNLNMNVVFLSSAPICRCHHQGYPSTAAPRSSGNSCTSNALTPHKANKPGTKRRRGRRKRALLPIPGWEPPAQCPSNTACHTPPQPPAPTIQPAHIFTNFLSPSTHPHTHRGDPWGLWALVFWGLPVAGVGAWPLPLHPLCPPSPARSWRASATWPLVQAAFYLPLRPSHPSHLPEGSRKGGQEGEQKGPFQVLHKR